MESVLLLAGLGVASVQDLKWKKVWLPLPWAITVIVLIKNYFDSRNSLSWLMCFLFFILFFLVAHRVSNGQIGVGDAFLFGMTGAGLGWRENFLLVYVTFFLAFLAGLFLVLVRKKGRRYEIPLSPFMFVAFVFLKSGL